MRIDLSIYILKMKRENIRELFMTSHMISPGMRERKIIDIY